MIYNGADRDVGGLDGPGCANAIAPVRPIRPHQFQLDYLNRLMKKIENEVLLRKTVEKEEDGGFVQVDLVADDKKIVDSSA